MIGPDSRYKTSAIEYPKCHTYDADGAVELNDAQEPAVTTRETSYLQNDQLTTPPDKNYIFRETDSFDLLAHTQFLDPRRWWEIADVNPHIRHPFDPRMGDEISLPS